jgi:phage shock protein E
VVRVITRDELRRLVSEEAAQIVDVLSPVEYDEEHIPGAISLPIRELDAATARRLDPSQPVITYCHDSL